MLKLKKLTGTSFAILLALSLGSSVFANTVKTPENSSISDIMLETNVDSPDITYSERKAAEEDGMEIVTKISNAEILQELVDKGEISLGENGELPNNVTVYKSIEEEVPPNADSKNLRTALSSDISVSKTDYYDGRYFDDYDRYIVDGPSQFSQTYSTSSTANWNSSMTGSIKVGGKAYGVVDVEGSVSKTMGYTIGKSYTKTSNYSINIPAKKYWEIKVWTSYRVFNYTAKVGTTTLSTGKSWYPNGLVILKTEYNR